MADMNSMPTYPGWTTVRRIGTGSFGAVYEIERDLFGKKEKAALKVMSIPQNESDVDELYGSGYDDASITAHFEGFLADIVREYSLMAEMKGHTNVVYCDDIRYPQKSEGFGWDIYIKMELLTPLMKALTGDASEEQVIQIGKDICKALVLCRSRNIVHRDIKPQNIFVSKDGDYKLGDFGIAKTVERTSGGTKIGTYNYMAPEVYNNQPYGHSADIYSLGLVLYWLLNERRMPFVPLPPAIPKTSEIDEARQRRFRGEPLPAPAHGSEELKRIVLKACAYDPKGRYQSAEEMLRDLGWSSQAAADEINLPAMNPSNAEPRDHITVQPETLEEDDDPGTIGVFENCKDKAAKDDHKDSSGKAEAMPERIGEETDEITVSAFEHKKEQRTHQPLTPEHKSKSKCTLWPFLVGVALVAALFVVCLMSGIINLPSAISNANARYPLTNNKYLLIHEIQSSGEDGSVINSEEFYEYDENGFRTRGLAFSNGTLEAHLVYDCDTNGNITRTEAIESTVMYVDEYDSENRPTKRTYYISEGSYSQEMPEYVCELGYDDHGRLNKRMTHFYSEGRTVEDVFDGYHLVQCVTTNDSGEVEETITVVQVYDSNEYLVKESQFEIGEADPFLVMTFEYDATGNLIRQIQKFDHGLILTIEYEYMLLEDVIANGGYSYLDIQSIESIMRADIKDIKDIIFEGGGRRDLLLSDGTPRAALQLFPDFIEVINYQALTRYCFKFKNELLTELEVFHEVEGEGSGIFLRPTYEDNGYISEIAVSTSDGTISAEYGTKSGQLDYIENGDYNLSFFAFDVVSEGDQHCAQIGFEIFDEYGRIICLSLLDGRLEQLDFSDERTEIAYFYFKDHGLSDVTNAFLSVDITDMIKQTSGHTLSILQYLTDGTVKVLDTQLFDNDWNLISNND